MSIVSGCYFSQNFPTFEPMAETGRPPKFESVEQLAETAEQYFVWIRGEKEIVVHDDGEREERWKRPPEPPTITGFCLFLGFESRQSFHDYCEKSEFSYALKRFRTMIECKYEQNLHGTSPTGSIFALKNMGWKDKTEVENTGNMTLNWNETKTYEKKEGL